MTEKTNRRCRDLPRWLRRCGACAALALLLPSVALPFGAEDLPDLGESARAEMPQQLERRIGESIMNDIRLRESTYIDDPDVNDYLARLGGKLVEASSSPSGDFHFFALRDPSINAFAMFGGYIGVNSGTLLSSQSESELAGVIAHEIAHITQSHLARQIAREKQNTIPMMVAMAMGILAARSNANVGAATVAATQAGAIQSYLAYSRDFEREADRMGYQTLDKAGFDVRGMGDFFDRLQKAGRLYDYNAPVYLRSHPMTLERMSDMQSRAQDAPYRQVVSSLDFHLIRAKLKAQSGTPSEAIREFSNQLREKKYASLPAVHYGLAVAHMRNQDVAAAQREVDTLRTLKAASSSPILYALASEVRAAQGDFEGAQGLYRDGMQRYPQAKALVYGYAEALYAAKQYEKAQLFLDNQLQLRPSDYKLHGLQARNYAAQGKRLQQHRAQAEFYMLQGQLGQAVEQLQYAQQATDGNFYEQSAVDARLRELRRLQAEEAKLRRGGL